MGNRKHEAQKIIEQVLRQRCQDENDEFSAYMEDDWPYDEPLGDNFPALEIDDSDSCLDELDLGDELALQKLCEARDRDPSAFYDDGF